MSFVKSSVRTLALVAVGVSALLSVPAAARDASYTVTMNQDSFFGFNPSFNGLVPAGDNVDFSFYGTFWTRPAFGLGGSGGSLWTEFGVGANFNLDESLAWAPISTLMMAG
ncbi:MAG: hypothetical protein MUE77_06180 [Sandarakinorhabdus sp.]|nr:hypothetical protein [Sandarakinorhabdus sp.]